MAFSDNMRAVFGREFRSPWSPSTGAGAGREYDAKWLGGVRRGVGIVTVILVAQVFVYLAAVENSLVLGVSLSEFAGVMLVYLIFDFLSIAVLLSTDLSTLAIGRLGGRRTQVGHHRVRMGLDFVNLASGGSYADFLTAYSAAFFGTLALLTLLAHYAGGPQPGVLLSDPEALKNLIFYGLFVGPTETIFFVIALPAILSWVYSAVVVFALFHLPVDVLTYGTGDPALLLNAFVFRAALGFLLYVVYVYFGPGATISAHTTYDIYVVGAIAPFPLGLSHLGLLPL